jgi:hypothetical protein
MADWKALLMVERWDLLGQPMVLLTVLLMVLTSEYSMVGLMVGEKALQRGTTMAIQMAPMMAVGKARHLVMLSEVAMSVSTMVPRKEFGKVRHWVDLSG